MHLIWHGTASVEVVCSSGRMLFDPFVPLKGSTSDVGIGDFDGIPFIFVTHGHIDHIVSIPEIVRRNPSVAVYCTRTPFRTLAGKGVPEENLRQIEYGQVLRVGGFTIEVFHSRHAVLPKPGLPYAVSMLRSPYRGNLPYILREHLRCRENGESVFYQVEADGRSLSLMGSLNLREDTGYPVGADLLVLPYNGWEDNYPPAVRAIERLSPKRVVLDHYDDTFPPVTQPVDLSPILHRYAGLVTPLQPGKEEQI